MPSFMKTCRAVLVEVFVYLWCNATRLLFHLWFFWQRPRSVPPAKDDILLRSATSLAAAIRNGEVKSVDVISAYIRRIEEVQPIINAVVEERFEEALQDAEEVDRLVASGTMSVQQLSEEKPLLGVPFSIKDSIAVKGMRQDAGSLMYRGRRAVEDAPTVARMRAAGAIPLVLTNVPELCLWTDAHNLLYGTTRNPHDTRRGPGGSSGGEGSLLASAGSLVGLGTDIGGSVRIPAAYCGIFSHKPTAGVVPNTGLLPDVGDNMRIYNCVGPMVRFSEDLPLLLKVLAGSTAEEIKLSEEVDIKGLKVFFTETEGSLYFSRVTSEARQAVRKVKRHLQEVVGSEIHPLRVPELQYALITWFKFSAAREPQFMELNDGNVFVGILRSLVGAGRHTLAMLISNKLAAALRFTRRQDAEEFLDSVDAVRERLEKVLGDNGVLIVPAEPSTAPYHHQDLLFFDSPGMANLFSILKMPATACPVMKAANGLPLAVQVVAKRGNDRLCLAVAKEIERHFGGWIQPGIRNISNE
uniref:Putative lipid particle n=1 Tax=Amblyomma triste TaxID=251400 RepID=A0A023GDQ2_AMBTT